MTKNKKNNSKKQEIIYKYRQERAKESLKVLKEIFTLLVSIVYGVIVSSLSWFGFVFNGFNIMSSNVYSFLFGWVVAYLVYYFYKNLFLK